MAAEQQQDSQKAPGRIPTAPKVDGPAQRDRPGQADSETLGIDPQPRQGHVPTAPHGGSSSGQAGGERGGESSGGRQQD